MPEVLPVFHALVMLLPLRPVMIELGRVRFVDVVQVRKTQLQQKWLNCIGATVTLRSAGVDVLLTFCCACGEALG